MEKQVLEFPEKNFIKYLYYDDYIKTPIFLVPIEIALEGKRQFSFILFAIVVAVFMESIPLLLSGIYVSSKQDISLNGQEIILTSNSNEDINKDLNGKKNHSKRFKVTKTIMSQISKVISSFIDELRKLKSEMFKAVSGTDDLHNMLSERLSKAMFSALFYDSEKRYKFLLSFYEATDPNQHEEISLSSFSFKDDSEEDKYYSKIAASLFISIMRDPRVRWLEKCNKERYPKNQLSSNFSFINLHFWGQNGIQEDNEDVEPEVQKWRFTNSAIYQKFMDWWLNEQSTQESDEEYPETFQAKTELEITHETEYRNDGS